MEGIDRVAEATLYREGLSRTDKETNTIHSSAPVMESKE